MAALQLKHRILETCRKEPGQSIEQILPDILPVLAAEAVEELFNAGYVDAVFGDTTYIHGIVAIENIRITEKGIHYLDSINSFFSSSAF